MEYFVNGCVIACYAITNGSRSFLPLKKLILSRCRRKINIFSFFVFISIGPHSRVSEHLSAAEAVSPGSVNKDIRCILASELWTFKNCALNSSNMTFSSHVFLTLDLQCAFCVYDYSTCILNDMFVTHRFCAVWVERLTSDSLYFLYWKLYFIIKFLE